MANSHICPRCNTTLDSKQTRLGKIYECSNCRGRLATMPVLRRLIAKKTLSEIWQSAQAAPKGSGVACPVCSHKSRCFTVSGVELDACTSCYVVWLDNHELQQLPMNPQKEVNGKRSQGTSTPFRITKYGEPSATSGDIVDDRPLEDLEYYDMVDPDLLTPEERKEAAIARVRSQRGRTTSPLGSRETSPPEGASWLPALFNLPIAEEDYPTQRPWGVYVITTILFIALLAWLVSKGSHDPETAEKAAQAAEKTRRNFPLVGIIQSALCLYFMFSFGGRYERTAGGFHLLAAFLFSMLGGVFASQIFFSTFCTFGEAVAGGVLGVLICYLLSEPGAKITVMFMPRTQSYSGWRRRHAWEPLEEVRTRPRAGSLPRWLEISAWSIIPTFVMIYAFGTMRIYFRPQLSTLGALFGGALGGAAFFLVMRLTESDSFKTPKR